MKNLLFISLLIHATLAQKSGKATSQWKTLNGDQPLVIARGGFSGLFPESSQFANEGALSNSMPNTVLYCDLQLSKDGVGFCLSDLMLDNSTNIASVYPKLSTTYNVKGKNLHGWFFADFTSDQLFKDVTMVQSVFTRTSSFDGAYPLSGVEDAMGIKPYQFWLNVQYDSFYMKRKLSSVDFIKTRRIDYVSSPEIGFLKNIGGKMSKGKTKFIFRFGNLEEIEPTSGEKYGSFLKDLGSIKSFASGILVPKSYIWPVGRDLYLQPATSLVIDAHKQGLEVYASGFANDLPASYNYSYDPIREYLQFVDNSVFSVDGVLSDFSPTASSAITCMAHNNSTIRLDKGRIMVISSNGSSGTYPGSTDLSYQQAIQDGADIIDCTIQVTKDRTPFCFGSTDLMSGTSAMSTFLSRSTKIPQLQPNNGIFAFDLTWAEIQTLKPQILNPYLSVGMFRNPSNKNKGNFVTLQSFLQYSANASLLLNIENAAYLATRGIDTISLVANAITNSSVGADKIFIKSDDTSVLEKFKAYRRVLSIDDRISDAPKAAVETIKKYADAVSIPRGSIIQSNGYAFTTRTTNVVDELHAANVSVYVKGFINEFTGIPMDYYSDPTVQLTTFIHSIKIDGVETPYPATAVAYLRSPCFDLKSNLPYHIFPVDPGSLVDLISKSEKMPSQAPIPPLEASDIVDPPLPEINVSAPPMASITSIGVRHVSNLWLFFYTCIILSLLLA